MWTLIGHADGYIVEGTEASIRNLYAQLCKHYHPHNFTVTNAQRKVVLGFGA